METDLCSQGCINVPGSYVCNCSEGFELNQDGFTCDGKPLQHSSHWPYKISNETSAYGDLNQGIGGGWSTVP